MTTSRAYRERLIDEVKRYPVLYDTRHENHRDIDVRDRCWNEIAAKLGANSEVLKREWKILRDSLRQSLKKASGKVLTKAGMPCKKWRFESRMAFLLPHMTIRNPRLRLREEIKQDETEVPVLEANEGDEWTNGGASTTASYDALELFFASVCASARRLPSTQQRNLKREVLDALQRCEVQAEAQADAPLPESSKTEDDNEF